MTEPQHPSSIGSPDGASNRLDSWKEIARYLKRDESTVQRWEKRERMPVHRHLHEKRGSVYAFTAELDAWWQSRRQQLEHSKATEVENGPASGDDAAIQMRGWSRAWWIGAGALMLGAAILLGFRWIPVFSMSARRANPSLVRLTSTSGLTIDPALSADGSLLAYASDRGESDALDIWVQPTNAEKPTRVTSQAGDEVEPSFSPDGASIVFAKGETGGIYVVGAVGGEPRLLVSAMRAHTPRFSPDGRWVTYWTGLPAWAVLRSARATGALFVVPSGGGSPRTLAPEFADARYPIWSPNGEKLLFLGESERAAQSSLDWYVVDRDGRESIRTGAINVLREAGVSGLPIPAAWSPDGVIFATYDDGASNVWQLAMSSTGRVVGKPVRLTFGTAIERSPSVSSSGRVAFASLVENVDVWRVPLDPASGLARGAVERVTDNAAIDRMINVSDEGRTMAFFSSRTGRDEIWIRDLQTGHDRQITYSSARSGRLSHDGSVIAVETGTAEKPGIELVPVNGSPVSALCDGCLPVDWSADDWRLLIRKGQARLFMRERSSGHEVEVTTHPAWTLNQGRLGPDDRWIVFHTANTPSLRQVYAVPTFAKGPVPVEAWTPIVTDFGMQPTWSPDGSAVYYFSLRDGAFCAWLQPLDPQTKRPVGPPLAVQHFHEPRLRAVTGAMVTNHVAAGYLYVTLTETAGNVWMLNR